MDKEILWFIKSEVEKAQINYDRGVYSADKAIGHMAGMNNLAALWYDYSLMKEIGDKMRALPHMPAPRDRKTENSPAEIYGVTLAEILYACQHMNENPEEKLRLIFEKTEQAFAKVERMRGIVQERLGDPM